jgi:hypothetical protein
VAVESDVAVVAPLASATAGGGSVTSDADATLAGMAVVAAAQPHTSVTIAVRSACAIPGLAGRARHAASGLKSLDQRDTSLPDSNTGRPPRRLNVPQSSQHPAKRNRGLFFQKQPGIWFIHRSPDDGSVVRR